MVTNGSKERTSVGANAGLQTYVFILLHLIIYSVIKVSFQPLLGSVLTLHVPPREALHPYSPMELRAPCRSPVEPRYSNLGSILWHSLALLPGFASALQYPGTLSGACPLEPCIIADSEATYLGAQDIAGSFCNMVRDLVRRSICRMAHL